MSFSSTSRTVICIPVVSMGIIDTALDSNREVDTETQQIFLPYRGFCSRKGVQVREVVLEDVDVSKAITDYINNNYISNIVVGASSRNAITRRFRNADVASCLTKSAPDFCTVYVISKGKVSTVRSASRPVPAPSNPNPPPSKQPLIVLPPQFPPDQFESDDSIKSPFGKGWKSPGGASLERGSIERSSDYGSGSMRFLSGDLTSENLELHSDTSPRSSSSSSTQSVREVEAEMKRLKLELRQTMELYSVACKEAISAKQKALELHQWQMEESRKLEEARQAEEAALAIAEKEKARCKAAIEAAEAAQRLAEMEANKRKNAEIKAMRELEEKVRVLDALASNDFRYRKYTIEEIEAATESFTPSMKIGEGGYGPVYKATLDHTPVAIKVLRQDAAQGRKQFHQEVEILSCIRHPNMVLLLGACPEYGCLVYEYMENGSLEDRLFRRGNTPPIPWQIRFKIAAEIATGLLFLHQTKPEPLVHRDLKPANILLDINYVSKISDVGLARLVPPSVADSITQYHMTATAGTFCYIDPEYQQTGKLGIKSDIYSLGVLLLQIITARPPMGLTHTVEKAISKGTLAELLDPTVPDWPVEEALVFAKLALKCSELRKKDRPDLGTVVLPELNRLRNLGNNELPTLNYFNYGPRSSNVSSSQYSTPRFSFPSLEFMKSSSSMTLLQQKPAMKITWH
uniref:RING-type E3 ubiquitin transferase n=1 Tax=Nelumbo nucifera TaxID=4432 RepID=A0A822ZRB3_NELNU|nr:TPA_asm: hypothetical protein HUJ06_002588 [Nelumbo nucifera]